MSSLQKIIPALFELEDILSESSNDVYIQYTAINDISNYKLEIDEVNNYSNLSELFPDEDIIWIDITNTLVHKQELLTEFSNSQNIAKALHMYIDINTYDYGKQYMHRELIDNYCLLPTLRLNSGGISDYIYITQSGDLVIIHVKGCVCCQDGEVIPFRK